jgi:hypothetical protein
MQDSLYYNGKTYTAQVELGDKEAFAAPCKSRGTKRCMITEPHSSYIHLVIGLAEQAGTIN